MSVLSSNYKAACVAYIRAFEKKQGMEFFGWIGDYVGELADFSGWVFNLSDIIHDIDTKQPKGNIIAWYDACIDNAPQRINYSSWCMGLRFEQLTKE